MYEQFLKTWQIPQTAALQGNPWGNLGSVGTAAAQQAVTLQRQWIGQVTEMCGLKGPARDFTLGMFENASQLYLTAVERQLEWLQSVTTLFAPSAIPSASPRKAVAQPARAAAPVVAPAPAPVVKAVPLATAAPAKDDLKLITGIGPALEKKLNAEGIVSFSQIAALTASDIARLEETVIKFPGRIERDGWVAQARQLASA